MKVELTAEEVAILKDLVEERIEELGPEIHHARTPDYHDALKQSRELLRKLSQRLQPAEAV